MMKTTLAKRIRIWRWVDFSGQLLLLVLTGIAWGRGATAGTGYLLYFGVGGWQAVSCIAWALTLPPAGKCAARRGYERFFILLLVIAIASWLIPAAGWPILLFLAAASPLAALWYILLTAYEVRWGNP